MKVKRFNENTEDFTQEPIEGAQGGLKMVTKVINEVDYYDFDRFVEKQYGGTCEFPADHESSNDTSHNMGYIGKGVDKWSQEEAAKIRSGQYPGFSGSTILECLCEDGLIPKGEYIINVSW